MIRRIPSSYYPSRRPHGDAIFLLIYILLAFVMTYPLALNFNTGLPGIGGDSWSYLWTLGWAKLAFLVGTNPLHSDYIFYPLGGATQFFWATSLIAGISIPLQSFIGLVPTFNILYLAASAVTAYGTFLLAKEIGVSQPAAFGAGLVFAFGALRGGYGLAFFNLYQTQFIPFYALFLIRTFRAPGWRNPILAGILLGLHAYLDFQMLVFIAIFSVLFILGDRKGMPLHVYLRTRIPRSAVAASIAFVVMVPMIFAVRNEFGIEGGEYIRVFPLRYSTARSYDLFSYFLPHGRSTLYQTLPVFRVAGVNAAVSVEGESQLSPDRQVFLGYLTLALTAAGLVWDRNRARVWSFVALTFATFSFGPFLHVLGVNTGIPLPFLALHQIPIVDQIRVPMRYGLFVCFAVAILASLGLDQVYRRLSLFRVTPKGSNQGAIMLRPLPIGSVTEWLIAAAVSILMLAEAAILPYPLQIFAPPKFYERLAREEGNLSILEIPSFNWRDAAETEVYQAIHHKRILRAYANRTAPDVADYFSQRQTPIIVRSLRILEGDESGSLTSDEVMQDALFTDMILPFYDLKYAVVHHDMLPPERDRVIRDYLRDVLDAREIESDASATLYAFEIRPRSLTGIGVETTTNIALMYLGRGWQIEPIAEIDGVSARFAKGAFSEIYFPSDSSMTALTLRALCEKPPGDVLVSLNDLVLTMLKFETDWQNFTLDLRGSLNAGMNRIVLRFAESQAENCAIEKIGWQ